MKNLIAAVLVLTTFVFASCTKKEVNTSSTSSAPYQISVEYFIESESGHFTCAYSVPDGNTFVTQQYQIDRAQYSYKFNCMSGNLLSLKAYNTIPSGKSVKVTILVNGATYKFGEANAPAAVASVEGRY